MIGSKHTLTNWRQAERGQTVQDFAVGIGIFILAIGFVFAFIPSVMDPYTVSSNAADQAQADRIAAAVLADLEEEEEGVPNQINPDLDGVIGDLEADIGLRSIDTVSIGLWEVGEDGDMVLDRETATSDDIDHTDDDYVTSATRLVSTPTTTECDPACRLEVKIW